ncbi:VanZ family protein [Brevibacillus sp. HB1.2]|uniref:VanZ family protein n=1 Tax=unclassified Brevibacillus TaxID=2684853 RepID=UPI00037A16D6|nr:MULTISPECIES: VanZ family protein [unclassified Brevibacillus]ATF16223.1 VanZ family protein [Brevibacillus brevis X23]NTU21489.1 VanZ family protein [Brevibacillus sp. HB1.2]NTU31359.1 VanZ family protein [Brevibacillus sp. HB1.1]
MDNVQKIERPTELLAIAGYAVFALYLFLVVKILLFKFGSLDTSLLVDQWKIIWSDPSVIVKRLRYQSNLVPFHEIENYVRSIRNYQSWHSAVNFVGNVIAFMPLGFLLPLLFPKKAGSLFRVTLLSLLLSLGVELTQLVMNVGTFDVDDLLLNTAGGMIGYIVYLFIWVIQKKRFIISVTS